jgi:hypothetical protein
LFASNSYALEQDKKKHFAVSAVIGGASQHYFKDYRYSIALCMSIGLAKELTDSHIDNKDLLADALGCATGILTYEAVNYMINVKPLEDGAKVSLNYKF